jgi:hypothetical protein
MTRYIAFEDIASLLHTNQLVYAREVFLRLGRKLTLREFAIILRAMERGISAMSITSALISNWENMFICLGQQPNPN